MAFPAFRNLGAHFKTRWTFVSRAPRCTTSLLRNDYLAGESDTAGDGNHKVHTSKAIGWGSASRFLHGLGGSSARLNVESSSKPAEVLPGFPGAKVRFTEALKFSSETNAQSMPSFRLLSDEGELLSTKFDQVDKAFAQKMYQHMVSLQILDHVFYNAQRQGSISFYATCTGEEVLNVACAAALGDTDTIFPQYREPGVLLWRGFKLQEFADQCVGNCEGHGKGRQMAIHFGSDKLFYYTVSSVLGTQLPHAVGAGYSLKMDKERRCSVAFFGEGAASEGDFHGAVNFAAVLEVPILFICRNNGWAISTPSTEQYRGDGIAGRGKAYGVKSIRIDGNDGLAIYSGVKAARQLAVDNHEPILIELMTYRVGHHSTSDDSTRYRDDSEMRYWRERHDGVARFRKWLESKGWWNDDLEGQFRTELQKEVIACLRTAEMKKRPPLADLFEDVYSALPRNLVEQEGLLREAVAKAPQHYPNNTL